MIGYDPDALMIHMGHKQIIGDILLANQGPEIETELREISKKNILEKTGLQAGCKATVCVSSGISLVGGMKPIHDHDDPDQHMLVEVTGIDHWGNITYVDESGKEGLTHMGMIILFDEES